MKTTRQGELEGVVANLRHAYEQLLLPGTFGVRSLPARAEFAEGLLARQIRRLEEILKEMTLTGATRLDPFDRPAYPDLPGGAQHPQQFSRNHKTHLSVTTTGAAEGKGVAVVRALPLELWSAVVWALAHNERAVVAYVRGRGRRTICQDTRATMARAEGR